MAPNLDSLSPGPISILSLIINLGVGAAFSLFIAWHFQKFGSTLSNRRNFAKVFPLIVLTTTLIITIVKSSLALSLGLVGALSIVRFRTPIKEPEELAYLFIAIAVGLGLGANQTKVTAIAACSILGATAVLSLRKSKHADKNLCLSVSYEKKKAVLGSTPEQITTVVNQFVRENDLRRVDSRENSLELLYLIEPKDSQSILKLTQKLEDGFPGIGVTVIDQNGLQAA